MSGDYQPLYLCFVYKSQGLSNAEGSHLGKQSPAVVGHKFSMVEYFALRVLAFLAGGGGIPAIDALVYHDMNPADSPQGVHLEPPGATCHTDACLTALTVIPGAEALQPMAVRPAAPGTSVREPDQGRAEPPLVHPSGPGLPRSPPLS